MRPLAVLLACALPVAAAAEELVMVDQVGCYWCQTWEAEIGPIYPKTSAGAFAPLRRIDIGDVAGAIEVERRVTYTPTFLLVEGDREVARLEGYPGEDFFWGLLEKMLSENTEFVPDERVE